MPNINLVENIKNITKSKIFRILFVFVFVFIIFLFSNTSTAFASDRYWIGGSGNWSDTAHWSDSDGGAGGFSVPTSADNVFFSAGSFNVNGAVVTLDVVANTANLNFAGIDQTVTFSSSVNSINIYGGLNLPAANLTWTFTGTAYIYLKATTSVNITMGTTITGRTLNRVYFDGVGGTWTLQDTFHPTPNAALYLENGTLDFNEKTMQLSGGTLTSSNNNIRHLKLTGNSILYTGGLTVTGSNFTLSKGTSIVRTYALAGNILDFNIIELYPIVSYNSYSGFTATETRIYAHNFPCNITGNITTNNLILTGSNSTNQRVLVASNSIGTQRTITVNPANVVASNVDFRDIRFANPIDLSGISGGSGDAGGNNGITFTTAQPQWFKHTSGTVNWSDSTKWFSDQAKTIPGRVPLPQDDATFDSGSFTGTSNLSVNVPRIGKNMDMSMINQAVTFNMVNDIEVYGSFTLNNSITLNGMKDLSLHGRNGNYSISTFNKIIYAIRVFGNQYTLLSDLYTVNAFVMKASALSWIDLNDFNVSCDNNYSANVAGTAYMGNGTFEIRSNVTGPKFSASTNFFAENSTIKFTAPSGTSSPSFVGDGKTYNKLWFAGAHTGTFNISGNNTISELIIDPGRNVRFTAGTTQQIGKLTANGTALNPITIGSVTGATHTLNYTGATNVVGDYLNISYSNATPANKWFASNSINSGNNTGWIFANIPDMPTGLTPTAGNTQMSLSWTAPVSDGGNAITDYVVEYKLSTDSTWTIFADAISTLTTTTVIGLTNGKSYDFRVYAVNNVGQGTASAVASSSPFSPNDRYWVGGTGNWSDTAHWANTDGGVGGQSVPTSTNDVYFSAGSFSVDGNTVTLDVVANTKSLDFSGIDQTVTFSSSVNSINIYGVLNLPATNLTWTFTGTAYTYLKATTSVNITMGATTGRTFNRLYFDGVGGTWTLQDEMNIGLNISSIYLNNGTFNTNSQTLTFNLFNTSAGTKTFTTTNSVINLRNWQPLSDYTLNSAGSIINVYDSDFIGLNKTFNDVNFIVPSILLIQGNNTYNNVSRISGSNITSNITFSGNQTINGTLTLTGNNSTNNRLLVASNITGTPRTITVNGSIVASNVDFRDITLAGSANRDLSAIPGLSGDAGGNTGITFTTAQPQWFKHTSGAVNWSDSTKWFSDQAKTIPGRVPLPQDDATFDASSFTGASTLPLPTPKYEGSAN